MSPAVSLTVHSFSDQLKDYRQQFELMLEGENHVDRCKQKLSNLEAKESKIRKELKKSMKKGCNEEVEELEIQLKQATDARNLANEEGKHLVFKKNETTQNLNSRLILIASNRNIQRK